MTDGQGNEIKRHFDVVAEGLHHEIRLIIEEQAATEKKLNEHRAETRRNKRELRIIGSLNINSGVIAEPQMSPIKARGVKFGGSK